jgi:hypothetical protein
MRRLFLTAKIGMGLISASCPAIASQSIDPCHKQCSKYYKNNTYGDCRNVCDRGKVYTAPATNSSTASPAPASKDSAAAPMNNERIKRLRELRERSKGSAGEAQAQREYRPECRAAAHLEQRRRRQQQQQPQGEARRFLKGGGQRGDQGRGRQFELTTSASAAGCAE